MPSSFLCTNPELDEIFKEELPKNMVDPLSNSSPLSVLEPSALSQYESEPNTPSLFESEFKDLPQYVKESSSNLQPENLPQHEKESLSTLSEEDGLVVADSVKRKLFCLIDRKKDALSRTMHKTKLA